MCYWWVNQNQTFHQKVEGGYLWSPKRSAGGARNPFYELMREVSPGDLIFSFMDTRIQAMGIAQSYCWESPKPIEFGSAGSNWETSAEGESCLLRPHLENTTQGPHRHPPAPPSRTIFTLAAKWEWPPVGLLDRTSCDVCRGLIGADRA